MKTEKNRRVSDTFTVIELLQQKYGETEHTTVTDWMKESGVDLSLQSCTSVLLRGQDKGLVVMLTLAAALKCTPEEMQWIAQQKGDRTLWRLITKESITAEEHKLLDVWHKLTQAQRTIISSMIKEMAP
jgi:hypothetical protein